MFFNVLSSVATFITVTLAGILIGKNNTVLESTQTNESQPIQSSEPTYSTVVDELDDLDDFIE
jgi:hypothetical protein